ncbi:MAG: transposase [Rubrivivax sp.]|nr:transposase [Rubrivivax sp.]
MARQSRLFVPGCPHLVGLPALAGLDPCPAEGDRRQMWQLLFETAASAHVRVHAAALLPGEIRLLATPQDLPGLSVWVQALGRRYVSAYNRAHGRSGTLWAGRFRAAAVAPGDWALAALRYVDGASSEPGRTGAGQRCGEPRQWPLSDPPEYWSLGNTPFERERTYAALLAEPLAGAHVDRLTRALRGGWPCGEAGFLRQVEAEHARPSQPRPRGRPALPRQQRP